MAKISIYSPQIAIPVAQAPQMRADQTGLVIADAAERVANAWDQKAKQDANVYAATEASRLRLQFRKSLNEDYNNGKISSGYTQTKLDELQQARADVLSRAPNRYATELSTLAMNDVEGDLTEMSMRFEAEANVSNKTTSLTETLNNNANLAANVGTTYNDVLRLTEETRRAIAGSGLPTKVANSMIAATNSTIGEAWLGMMAEHAPQELINGLESGKLNGLVDSNQKAAFINRAQTTIRQQKADIDAAKSDADKQLTLDLRDGVAMINAGSKLSDVIKAFPSLDPMVLEAAGKKDEAALVIGAEAARDARVTAGKMTPAERAARKQTAKERITGNPQGAAGAAAPAQDELQAIHDIETVAEQNPYQIAAEDDAFNAASNALIKYQSQGGADPNVVNRHMATITSRAIAAQQRFGIPPEKIQAISGIEVGTIKDQLENAPGNERLAILTQLQERYGKENFPYIRKQLASAFKDNPLLVGVLALPDTEAAKKVASTLDVKNSDLEKEIDTNTQKDVLNRVVRDDGVKAFEAAMVPRSQNFAQLDAIKNVIRHSALQFVREGSTPSEAVRKASEAYFSSFKFVKTDAGGGSTIRLTQAVAPMAKEIINGTYAALHDPATKLVNFEGINNNIPGLTREQYVDSLKRSGKWLSSADGRGVFLYDENMRQVLVGGSPVFLPWAALAQAGRTSAVTGATPWRANNPKQPPKFPWERQ